MGPAGTKRLAVRILVVDDFEPFRRLILSILQPKQEFSVVGEACDGLEAVHKAQEFKPDLILLDIGLPSLNGIEVARQIRKLVPNSQIIFVTQESSPEGVEEALNVGARGYVLKTKVRSDLLNAIQTVLSGESFISKKSVVRW